MSNDLKFKISHKVTEDNSSNFTIKPLDRGYGITIGNSLRRALLTAVPGAAITNVKIEGAHHEFSTIDGVTEDVADIIMNLKGVRFHLFESKVEPIFLKVKGPNAFTAADIQAVSDDFTILNPDHHITDIAKGTTLEVELRLGIGKGYKSSEENKLNNTPVGMIPIDSIFNPVTKVSFNVSPLPGAKEDTEMLSLNVTTDGSITPIDAVSYCSSFLSEHYNIINSISNPSILEIDKPVSEEILQIRKLLESSIDEMELSVRSHNCLEAAGITLIGELVDKDEAEMLEYKNFGRKSLNELIEKLEAMGLKFGMDTSPYTEDEA
ncbi:MAG: DNA-directed RNA polymerase subunit alpha [Candidatus Neomarinimicrobiota bacterium]